MKQAERLKALPLLQTCGTPTAARTAENPSLPTAARTAENPSLPTAALHGLYRAQNAGEAARYAQMLANRPDCGRLCLIQTTGGAWAVCLVRAQF